MRGRAGAGPSPGSARPFGRAILCVYSGGLGPALLSIIRRSGALHVNKRLFGGARARSKGQAVDIAGYLYIPNSRTLSIRVARRFMFTNQAKFVSLF